MRVGAWLLAASIGGLIPLALHGAALAAWLVPAWQKLARPLRAELASITPHLALFQAELACSVLLAGALAGVAVRLALISVRITPSRRRIASGVLLLSALELAHAVAHRPAMFEDFLWRAGGFRAAIQVAIAEEIGDRAFHLFAGFALVAFASMAAWVQRKQLRLRSLFPVAAAALLALLLPFARQGAGAGPAVIILAADSLRPDHFSSEGYPRKTTPRIDELRSRGLWVNDLYVPIASTTASWASLLTGVYPHRHGIRDLFPRAESTRMHLPTLPAILAARGYETAVVSDYAGESFNRVDFGFGRVVAPPATNLEIVAEREVLQRSPLALALLSGSLGRRLFDVAGYLPVNPDPALLTDRVESELDRLESSGKPFLLVAFYSVTHVPFAAPAPDLLRFADHSYRGPSRYSYELQQLDDLARASTAPAASEVRHVRALYDGALHAFDREAGKILDKLERDGVKQRLVIVLGDHGENLFEPGTTTEHGKWFVGGVAANRAPLLLQGLNIPIGQLESLASGVDLTPTILDALGLPLPQGMDGLSLLRPANADRTVFAESTLTLGGPAAAPPGTISYPSLTELLEVEPQTHALVLKRKYIDLTTTAKQRSARRGPWELVYAPGTRGSRWELFNLQQDPFAQRDVSSNHPAVFTSLREELLQWLRKDPLRWLDADDHLVYRVEQ